MNCPIVAYDGRSSTGAFGSMIFSPYSKNRPTPRKGHRALQKVVDEMENRYDFSSGARNIAGFNAKVAEHNSLR